MTAPRKIVIIGAGIGGLVAALSMLRAGLDVRVLEQAGALGEVGAGVQLSANATRVLGLLGLDEALASIGSEPAGKEIRLWSTGQTWKLFDLGATSRSSYGAPYLTMHRADLHTALVDAVRALSPKCIELNARCIGVEARGERPIVLLEGGRTVEADIVVGADGVHSKTRSYVVGPDRPRYSGCMAWRGVIPAARLPEHLRASVGVNWVGPGRHVIHYPMRRGELINFVGIVEKQGWEVESWTQQGTVAECLQDFSGWHQDVATLIESIEQHYKWALMVRDPIDNWTEGLVTLLGDAAHPTLPFLAQGAAMAIEDGHVLSRALQAYPDDTPRALKAYQSARVERTSRIVLGSAENAARFHNPLLADAAGAQRYIDEQWQAERVKQRYGWLFEYRADEVDV